MSPATIPTYSPPTAQPVNRLAGVDLPLSDPAAIGSAAAAPPLLLTDDLKAELGEQSRRLESATPHEILRWAIDRFGFRFGMATAFGPEGMSLICMLAQIDAGTPIFNLDTGYQFPETLAMVDRVRDRFGIEIELRKPAIDVEEYERTNGGPVYLHDTNKCCGDRKLAVQRDAAKGLHAWASAIRRDQSPVRSATPIVGWDAKFHLVKVSPLANWTKQQVWSFILKNDVPYNPLHDAGYPSIGCWPCTRAVAAGEDERAGRWSGSGKTECGLHT